ncbi:MAG: hemolysin family protein [Paracoccaceae bacterium]
MDDNSEGTGRPEKSSAGEESDPPSPEKISFFERLFGSEPKPEQSKTPSTDGFPGVANGAQEMLVNLRNMHNMRVEDVYVPKADIVAVPEDADLATVVDLFRKSGFTRIPVYSETLDNPLGFVHLKDLALRYGFGESDGKFELRPIVRPVLFAPPSMPIGALLQKMQGMRVHMALVIDEYGGVDGLVTIEDLLEQIVGEIADEHDADEAEPWVEESPGVYLAFAKSPLDEFEAMAGVDLLPDDLDEDVESLGGLVFMLCGRVPTRGEIIQHPDGHEFEVIDADPRRIKRLRVRIHSPAALDRAAE